MAVNDLGSVQQGAIGPGNIPSELLIYDKDKMGMLLYLEQGTTKMMHMIHKEFGKRNVTSFTPKWSDINQLDDIFTVTVDQTQATWNKVEMANQLAIQLQPGDLLAVSTVYMEDGGHGGTAGVYSDKITATARMEEQILVLDEPIQDSSRVGYAWVNVRRGYANNYTTNKLMAQPSYSATGLIKLGSKLLKMGNTHWTGSDAPRGITKILELDSNPLQIMRFAFEEQTEASMERSYMPESQMDINQKLALRKMGFEMEYRAMFSSPVIEQLNESWRYTTGGLFHYLDDNMIDYSNGGVIPNWDWTSWQKNVMAPLFERGGSGTKVAYCSINTFAGLATMLWNKVTLTVNETWSDAFKFDIYKISGGGGELNIVPSWVYGRNPRRANQMLVLDFGGPYFKIDVMEDIHINKGPNGQGLQNNGQRIKKFEYFGIAGLQRRAKPYHAIIDGLPVI